MLLLLLGAYRVFFFFSRAGVRLGTSVRFSSVTGEGGEKAFFCWVCWSPLYFSRANNG